MNLARAFIERKRLTKEVENLADEFRYTQVIKNVKDKLPKRNADELFSKLQVSTKMLAKFNAAIEAANAKSGAKEILSSITGLKRIVNLLEAKVSDIDAFEPEKTRFDNYAYCEATKSRGDFVTDNFEIISTTPWEFELNAAKKEIRDLEDKLAEINLSTKVDIPDDLNDFISNL